MASELARSLLLAGAAPYLLLGLAHAYHTPLRPDQRKGLSPADPGLTQAMVATRPLLTRRTDMWLAWVGFNFSHSLGLVGFGLVALLIGRSNASFATQASVFGPLAVLVSGGYLVLAIRYWFRAPIAGCAFVFVCFLSSWVLVLIN